MPDLYRGLIIAGIAIILLIIILSIIVGILMRLALNHRGDGSPAFRYFQAEDFGVVMLLGMDESIPNAFMIASQDEYKFNDYIHQLAIGFEH